MTVIKLKYIVFLTLVCGDSNSSSKINPNLSTGDPGYIRYIGAAPVQRE